MEFSIISQIKGELNSILYGYPEFVFARRPKKLTDEMPVFVYHTIDPLSFESQLIFLKENGYRTLSIDEFLDRLIGNEPLDQPSVFLTVDDGRSSFWRFGYPLLKKYDSKATLFVIPGVTPDGTECRCNLFQVWNGAMSLREIHELDSKDETLCSWPEIKEMFDSGLVNIESHTLFHKEVFVCPKIVDFIDSNTSFTPYNSPVTAYFKAEDEGNDIDKKKYYGLPLFESAPLMQGRPAIKVSPNILEICRNFYQQQVSMVKPNIAWKNALRKLLSKCEFLNNPLYQHQSEILHEIRNDLETAKLRIHEKVAYYGAGNHLCLPYSLGSDLTLQVAKELGIKSCFWGVTSGHGINRPGDDPFQIVRLKNDFLWRLPATGRKNLLSIYRMKLKRRAVGNHVF